MQRLGGLLLRASPPSSPVKKRMLHFSQTSSDQDKNARNLKQRSSEGETAFKKLNLGGKGDVQKENESLFEGIDFNDSFEYSFNKSTSKHLSSSPVRQFSTSAFSPQRILFNDPPPSEFDIDVDLIASKYLHDDDPGRPADIIIDSDGLDPSSDIEIVAIRKAVKSKSIITKSKNAITITSPLIDAAPKVTAVPLLKGYFIKPASLKEPLPADLPPKAKIRTIKKRAGPILTPSQEARAIAKEAKVAKLKTKPIFNYQNFNTTKVKLIFSYDESEISNALNEMLKKTSTFGFDLEWPPSTRKGIENKTALAQIATSDTILLVHLARLPKQSSPSLSNFLMNPAIQKLGVQIMGDAKKWQRDFGEEISGLIELSDIAKTLDEKRWNSHFGLVGLQDLTGHYLDRYLSKDTGVRCGDWSSRLDASQKQYASDDVYASLQVYNELSSLSGRDLTTWATRFDGRRIQGLFPSLASTIESKAVDTNKLALVVEPIPEKILKASASPRVREAFDLFAAGSEVSLKEVTKKMSISRKISALSVIWNLLNYLEIAAQYPENAGDDRVTPERLLSLIDELPSTPMKITMLEEFPDFLRKIEKRVEGNETVSEA